MSPQDQRSWDTYAKQRKRKRSYVLHVISLTHPWAVHKLYEERQLHAPDLLTLFEWYQQARKRTDYAILDVEYVYE